MKKIFTAVAAIALVALGAASHAQEYPARQVRVLLPWLDGFPANSARLYTEELSKRYQRTFVGEVKSGAGGEVAGRQAAQSVADGYTLLATGSSITTRAAIDEKNVDGERDLQPIAQLTTTPYVLVANVGSFGSFENFLAKARAEPGKINFASAGVGTGMHFLGELLNANAGIDITHIPYPTGSRQLQAVFAGDVDIAIISLVTALPHIRAGKLEALVLSTSERSKVAPQIPTLWEFGFKSIPSMSAWIALFGPKNLDPAALASLSEKISEIANDPAVIQTVQSWGAELPDTRTEALRALVRSEKAAWVALIKERGLNVSTGQ